MAHEHPHREHAPEVRHGQDHWDERYRSRSRDAVWRRSPNAVLVAEAADLPPGRALDAASGEGADAVWLAERGWRVLAADLSPVALERAAARAAEEAPDAAGRIRWQQLDLTEQSPPAETFDLVTSHFLHVAPGERAAVVHRLAAAVAPGGTLLLVGHDPSDLQTGVGRPPQVELFATAGELAALLEPDDWEVLVADARPRPEQGPGGGPVTVRDAVVRARRRWLSGARAGGSRGRGAAAAGGRRPRRTP